MNSVKKIILARYYFGKFVDELKENQNITSSPILQDIYQKNDYQKLLQEVIDAIKENPKGDLVKLKYYLLEKSGLKNEIEKLVKVTQIAPGIIIDFGTEKSRDTILCGKSQECVMENGSLVESPKSIEENTIFDLASTSKLFMAISILKLNEMNLLDVFDPVTKYVPEFKNLDDDITIYDLLKFRVNIGTDERVDSAKSKEEAEQILFTIHKKESNNPNNAYTDMGAMVLRYVVERVSKMPYKEFVRSVILEPLNMKDTYLNVPEEKLARVANENYSTIIKWDGTAFTRYDNVPGTPHDAKAIAMGALEGVAPGHAGFF